MGSSDVKIEIDRSSTGGTFTNYDIIKGTVRLIVTNSITLNYIQVKLEGVSKSQLSIPRERRENGRRDRGRRERDRKDKLLQDVHKALYDTVIVFPPDNVRQVSQAKDFTLTPGNYSYPFEFKLPLNNSCVQLQGITNKVLFNKKNFDLIINNGNFNANTIKNMAQQYSQPMKGGGAPQKHRDYHIVSQLPPSLSGLGEFASIKYYVKVTCKRSSFLKANLRSVDPFIFLPLDLDSHNQPLVHGGDYEEYREVFVRKEMMFSDRIPEIVGLVVAPEKKPLPQAPSTSASASRKGFLLRFINGPASAPPTSSPSLSTRKKSDLVGVESKDVPFSFEVRFRHPAFLIPTKSPSFKLYFVSNIKPSRYSLAQYGKPEESNGLGVIYLQKLIVELTSTTIISVLETDGSVLDIHKAKHVDNINVCNNAYQNLKFDLKNCRRLKSSSATSTNATLNDVYELEIPRKYYDNCVLPDYLSPSFKTCNISRSYRLSIVAGISCEKVSDPTNASEVDRKVQYVDLQCPDIKVLSGLNMTSTLHSNASGTSLPGKTNGSPRPSYPFTGDEKRQGSFSSEITPTLPQRPVFPSEKRKPSAVSDVASYDDVSSDPQPLPTYDDVVRESSYQDNSEHLRARRRYQQHEQYYNNLDDA